MKTAICAMLVATALPLTAGAAAAPVCPVKPHHAVHAKMNKVVQNRAPGGIGVVVDQARLVSFPEPVKTLYVGNPWIADIQMVDAQHAFVLGKTFGVTNLIALSANGKEVSNQQVTVLNNRVAVTVNRGADQFNYACNLAHCESAPRPGDQKEYVSGTEQAATAHESVASAATTGGAQTASNQ
ncbi:MAG TPA: pilus assembly protein N-terminal domain-containing protein [Rhizomicrobium sp.]|nr:pilus assembly protein N-terminal domain-containing protein [Rhizomicrobium sp.]